MKIEVDKVFYIKNCQSCPFVNHDNTWGFDACNISEEASAIEYKKTGFYQMPSKTVHDKCPLKENRHIVKLDK